MKSAGSSPFTADDWTDMFFPAERKTKAQMDKDILEVAAKAEAAEAKAAKRNRPVQIKTFEC
jgi:hypothetical protein